MSLSQGLQNNGTNRIYRYINTDIKKGNFTKKNTVYNAHHIRDMCSSIAYVIDKASGQKQA